MRRIFTCSLALACACFSFSYSFGQCNSGSTFISGQTNTFDSNEEGFTGDFTWSNTSGGRLVSSAVSAGTTKVLTTSTYFLQATASTIAWGFDLSGNANVTSYAVEAIYDGAGSTVAICSGGALGNQTWNFNAPAPAQIKGHSFKLKLTFTVSGSNPQTKIIDNFRTSANASQIILPVHFAGFNARTISGGITLTWDVEAEENLSGYEIERSQDGRSFSKIGFVQASSQKSYSFTDNMPLANGYYRIKSVDVDGKYMYSTIISLKGGISVVVLKAFMSGQNTLTIQHDAALSGSRISISSADGRLIKLLTPSAGTQQTVTDLSAAKTGLYLIRFDNGNGATETLKLIKR